VSRLALLALALALVLAGCGGDARGAGTATLWVTRDRGAHVLYEGEVPAGLTAMQALDRRLDVDTRYGGRFVQAIDGIEGDAAKQRDWFWYVNGIEGDRSAAEYRLHPGDVEWWDYRSWHRQMRVPVVVGAFPEPFVHGFDGVRPGALVEAPDKALAQRLADLVHGDVSVKEGFGVDHADNFVLVDPRRPRESAIAVRRGSQVGLVLGTTAARRLARDQRALKFRYEVRG
jgi:hypothetical protein